MTNASGCVVKEWKVGDLMLINGHLDYSFIKSNNKPSIISDGWYDSDLLSKVTEIVSEININCILSITISNGRRRVSKI